MTRMRSTTVVAALTLLFVITACADEQPTSEVPPPAEAPVPADTFAVVDGWAAVASEGGTTAGYLTIENGLATADTLQGVTGEDMDRVEMHETYEREDGLRGMRPVEALVVAPDGRVRFEPGGLHLMLINMDRALAVGDSVEVTLSFAEHGPYPLTLPVRNR